MQIKIWSAFASNNSGSYTIVGSFPTAEAAAAVAAELAPLIAAQTEWLKIPKDRLASSPLEVLARNNGLVWDHDGEDWPKYGDKESPEVLAVGYQVIIHHDYTVTLPRFFGQFFYARGGRVASEFNHAQHPIAVVLSVEWPWNSKLFKRSSTIIEKLLAELTAPYGPLETYSEKGFPPAWRVSSEWLEADLTVGAVFSDLIAGCDAVHRVVTAHGASLGVTLFEVWSPPTDPFDFLRRGHTK